MNIKKPIDYSAMFVALDELMAANPPQVELYRGIGRVVSGRPEKGAAVATAEYLQGAYPDATGFSPRGLRRMRDSTILMKTPRRSWLRLCPSAGRRTWLSWRRI